MEVSKAEEEISSDASSVLEHIRTHKGKLATLVGTLIISLLVWIQQQTKHG
jgi:hypothetical protein